MTGEPAYIPLADVARRWGFRQTRTVAKIIRRHRPTAILRFSHQAPRVSIKAVLEIERELRKCGELDL